MSDAENRIDVVSPDGKLGSVPHSGLEAALAQGYTRPNKAQAAELENRKQYGTGFGTELKAGAEGAARGLTFGLSDLALSKSGLIDPQAMAERKARNPYAAGVGEAAGIGAGLLLPIGAIGAGVKGAAAAGELATKGAASLLSRAGVEGSTLASRALASGVKAATGSAVEGALYGAGQGISETALGDPADAAEKILGHATMGALLGGGLGGAAGALGGVGSKALERFSRPATESVEAAPSIAQRAMESQSAAKPANLIEQFLQDVAGEQALRAAGLPKSALKKLQRNVKPIVGAENSAEAEAAETLQLHSEAARIMREKRLAQAGDSFEDVGRRVEGAIADAKQRASDFIAKADKEAGPTFDLNAYAAKIRKYGEKFSDMPEQQAEYSQLLSRADAYDALAERSGGNITLAKAEEIKRSFDNAFSGAATGAAKQIARESRGIFNAQIEEAAQKAASTAKEFSEWKAAKREMEALIPVLEGNKNKLQTLTANRTFSLTDYIGGGSVVGALGAHPLGLAAGVAAAAGNKLMREYGSAAISDFAARAAQGLGANRGAQALQLMHIERTKNMMTQRLQSAADGIAKTLGQAPKAVTPLSVSAMDKLAMLPESKEQSDDQVTHALHNRVTEITNLAENPMLLQQRLEETMGTLPKFAPRLAAQMHFTAATAVQYLADKVPRNPYADSPRNVRQAWRPTATQAVTFERTIRAIHDPMGTIQEFEQGHVTREAADALRAIYPSIYGKLLEHVVPAIVQAPKVPLQRRLQLASMLGVELDTFTSTKFASAMQQAYAQSAKQAAPPARPGVSKNYRAEQSQTPLQRALSAGA